MVPPANGVEPPKICRPAYVTAHPSSCLR
jgi:hypothetical protein